MKSVSGIILACALLLAACGGKGEAPQDTVLPAAEYLKQANAHLGYANFPQWKETFDQEARRFLELLVKHHPDSPEAAKARDMLARFPEIVERIKMVAQLQEYANFGNINAGQSAYDSLVGKYPDLKPRADAIWEQAVKKNEKNREKYACQGNTVYVVSGSGGVADITYSGEGGGTSQESGAALPRKICFDSEPGQHLYVSAQNGSNSGTVKVQIFRNGRLLKETESSGAYVIATASGSAT